MMRLDLHVHTDRSPDSVMAPADIIRAVQQRRLDGVAITDHNAIDGALALQAVAPFRVIVGEEIKTTEGEIIGLFLGSLVPAGLSPEETIAAIREQEGIVYVPHPLDRIRRSAVGRHVLRRIAGRVDALEVINSRVLFPQENVAARRLAEQYGLAMGAGSDAHTAIEIGRAYVEVEPFSGPESFLAALRRGHVGGGLSSPFIHFASTFNKLINRFRGSAAS